LTLEPLSPSHLLAKRRKSARPLPSYRRQDVYEGAPGKFVTPKVQRKPPSTEVRMRLTKSPATLEPVAKRTPVSAPQPSALAVADKRKALPSIPKKP